MNKEEMVKEAYTLMVKNNPDEAIKNLIRLDKELDKKNKMVFKAIKALEKEIEQTDGCIYVELPEELYIKELQKYLDILKGEDE